MVFDKVKEIVAEQLDVAEDQITMEAVITDDLGADSLDVVDLVMDLEDAFSIEIPDEAMADIKTIGDIVTYQVGENRVTHRVIRKERKGYVTKGDANNKEDPTVVTADQIIGKVIFVLPCLGYVAVFVRQRTIFGILAVMIIQEMFFLLMQWKGERSRKSAEKIYEK